MLYGGVSLKKRCVTKSGKSVLRTQCSKQLWFQLPVTLKIDPFQNAACSFPCFGGTLGFPVNGQNRVPNKKNTIFPLKTKFKTMIECLTSSVKFSVYFFVIRPNSYQREVMKQLIPFMFTKKICDTISQAVSVH